MKRACARQRCPECHTTFRVLADEVGMHDCPECGYGERKDEPEPPTIVCPDCGQRIEQVSSATLGRALWQHQNWTSCLYQNWQRGNA
jgi:ssDNA-binding Zn-finger/Zn-ribbon topoisomerase 1